MSDKLYVTDKMVDMTLITCISGSSIPVIDISLFYTFFLILKLTKGIEEKANKINTLIRVRLFLKCDVGICFGH